MKNLLSLLAAAALLIVISKSIDLVSGFGSSPAQQSSTAAQTSGRPSEGIAAAPPTGVISLDRNFYVVVDGSGSMDERGCAGQFRTRIDGAKWAVKQFTEQNVPPDVNLGLYVFDRAGSGERVSLGKGNRREVVAAIDRVDAGGNTPLNGSIQAAVTQLAAQRDRQLGYGEFFVVVATDGAATDGDLATNAMPFASRHGIGIITIGFCLAAQHPLATGSISYRNANSPEELLSALKETQGESPYFDQAVFRNN